MTDDAVGYNLLTDLPIMSQQRLDFFEKRQELLLGYADLVGQLTNTPDLATQALTDRF